jgi:hypothetical protein
LNDDQSNETVSISSARVYTFSYDGNQTNDDVSYPREVVHSLKWRGPRQCRWHFICPVLSGNPCGSYQVSFVHNQTQRAVCRANVMHGGSLSHGQRLDFKLNFLLGVAENRLECFFWCSSDGAPPQEVDGDGSDDGQEALDRLVSVQPCYMTSL